MTTRHWIIGYICIALTSSACSQGTTPTNPADPLPQPPPMKDEDSRLTPRATLPSHTWVTVQNPDGITHPPPQGMLTFGATCSVDVGAVVERASVASADGKVLARMIAAKSGGYGAECPNGTLFFMTATEFDAAAARYTERENLEHQQTALERQQKQAVRALLVQKDAR
jgi:hypothetical protein